MYTMDCVGSVLNNNNIAGPHTRGGEERMVTIAEDCPASWWRQRSDSEDTEDTQDTSKTSAASSQARLVPCELVQIQSPSVTPARGYQGAFHQITRYTVQLSILQTGLEGRRELII